LLSGIRNGSTIIVPYDKVLSLRDLLAVNGSVIVDKEASGVQEMEAINYGVVQERAHDNKLQDFAVDDVRALLGRGPH
jgi:hypothetical protein